MPYSPKFHGAEGQVDKLDFEKILWKAVDGMRESMSNKDLDKFADNLQAMELLLTTAAKRSKKYEESYRSLDLKFQEDVKRAGNNLAMRNVSKYNKLLAWARALMMLIAEAGYMPERSGVYNQRRTDNDEEDD
jgi:hypothetical protein